jgi:predicted DCC family thiol-disulfide oxidoreductase YuxK
MMTKTNLVLEQPPVILFDGICNFCNRSINFLIRQDKQKRFRFAPLQSEAGQKLLEQYHLPKKDFDSFVLIENGNVYKCSTAGLRLYSMLPWYWKWTQVFWLVPKFFRDGIYRFIAKNRYRWFGKKEACMIPTPEMRSRFL